MTDTTLEQIQPAVADTTLERVKSAIEALDLEMIKLKLMDAEEGLGWSREYLDQVEAAYKRYLFLAFKHEGQPIVPLADVDKFWHQHILDTRKYANDCQRIFGHFFHHYPYFGMLGEKDAVEFEKAKKVTRQLYEQEFGESYNFFGEDMKCLHCSGTHCLPEI